MDERDGLGSSRHWHWRDVNNRPARRFEAVPNHRQSFPGSPVVHGTWRSKCQAAEGRFTLVDLVRWLVLSRPVTPTSWRSAPLAAVPCRQLAKPPIRILAVSPVQAFRAACRAGHRLSTLPTGHVSGLSGMPILSGIRPADQPPRSPETLAHRALRETLIAFPAQFPRPSSSVSNQAGGWPEANPIDSAIAPTAGRQTTSAQPGQRLPPKVHRTANALCFRVASIHAEYLPK